MSRQVSRGSAGDYQWTWNNRLVPNWGRSYIYIKAIYCHPAYLTYMQSTSCEIPGWMKPKLESRLPGEISVTSDTQMTPPYDRKQRGTEEPVDEVERAELKS